MVYSPERKEAALKRLLPPVSEAVRRVSTVTGIGEAMLYKWRNEARRAGRLAPDTIPIGEAIKVKPIAADIYADNAAM